MAQERQRDAAAPVTAESTQAAPKIRWDDTSMKSAYANFCNVASTREEIVLLFGVNQAWHSGQQEIPIQLTNRLIVSPHAAKRLSILLDNVVKEYETRFGPLPVSR